MRFPLVFLHVSEHVLPRLAREIIDANLAPNVAFRKNAEVPLHESPKLVLVRLQGNEAAYSLYVLKLLTIPALDKHRRRRARMIADRREADDQVGKKQRMGACWPIAPQYHGISIIDPFWHSGPKKPPRGIEDARFAVSVAMLSSRCVCAHVRRNPLMDSTIKRNRTARFREEADARRVDVPGGVFETAGNAHFTKQGAA